MGHNFGVRVKEHQKEVELQEGQKCAGITKRQSQSEQNKLAIPDHINTENHVINCDEATIIGRESDRTTRWIREAINETWDRCLKQKFRPSLNLGVTAPCRGAQPPKVWRFAESRCMMQNLNKAMQAGETSHQTRCVFSICLWL